MPFGLTNAPTVFQSLINDVLRDMLHQIVYVYLDDILIISRTAAEHRGHVRQVLQRLVENKIFVKAEKCEFSIPSVSFLGYILDEGQLRPDLANIQVVANWLKPATRKQLHQFLGFVHFCERFIKAKLQLLSPNLPPRPGPSCGLLRLR